VCLCVGVWVVWGERGSVECRNGRCLVPPPPPLWSVLRTMNMLLSTDLRSSLFTLHWWYTFGSTFDLRTFITLTQRELPDRRGIEQGKARSCLKFLLVLYVIKMKCRRLFKFHTVRILYILVYIYI
jgi:hypothetical protein